MGNLGVKAVNDLAKEMPTEYDALQAWIRVYYRLQQLGWQNIFTAPKDGSLFEVIQLGSCGIFKCTYFGKWPDGHFMVQDAGDVWPQGPYGLMWRSIKKDRK